MDKALPNFSNAQDALHAAEAFFARAAETCDANAQRCRGGRDAQFLQHVADCLRGLAGSLEAKRKSRAGSELKRFVQYTPDFAVPGGTQIAELQEHGSDAERTRQTLQHAAERWIAIHHELEASSIVRDASEFHESCRALMQRMLKDLTTAYVQRHDI